MGRGGRGGGGSRGGVSRSGGGSRGGGHSSSSNNRIRSTYSRSSSSYRSSSSSRSGSSIGSGISSSGYRRVNDNIRTARNLGSLINETSRTVNRSAERVNNSGAGLGPYGPGLNGKLLSGNYRFNEEVNYEELSPQEELASRKKHLNSLNARKEKSERANKKALALLIAAIVALFIGFIVLPLGDERFNVPKYAESVERLSEPFYDELNWLDSEMQNDIKEGADYFYKRTGIQPYLIICDDIGGYIPKPDSQMTQSDYAREEEIIEAYLQTEYERLFGSDPGYFIFLFCEYEPEYYIYWTQLGAGAANVLDSMDSGRVRLLTNIERHFDDLYYSNYDEGDMFKHLFIQIADTAMQTTSVATSKVIGIFIIIGAGIAILVAGATIMTNKSDKDVLDAEIKKVSNRITQLEFSEFERNDMEAEKKAENQEAEDLLNKYT